MFGAWYTSCVSCLWPQVDQESKRPQTRQHIGAEREMEICHSQPHLVPPMKLVFYGDLPSPGGNNTQSRSSVALPPWVNETMSLASKASQRASVLLTRKKTQTRPSISAPTDFRRVETQPRRRRSFRPLELSIYLPGNRLSDLPEFDHFDVDVPAPPSSPSKALMSPFGSISHRSGSGPFRLSRKPVGSAPSRRSSLGTVEMQLQQAKLQSQQNSDGVLLSPLIPHFSSLGAAGQHVVESSTQINHLPADSATTLVDVPSSSRSTAPTMTSRSSLDYKRATMYNNNGKKQLGQAQPFSFTSHNNNVVGTKHHQSVKSSSTIHSHSRIRTLSNSTTSSGTPSLSSAITAATTIYPSDKDIESTFTTLPMIPASAKNSVVIEDPQVLDGQQQGYPGGYEFDQRFPLSPVGVAF